MHNYSLFLMSACYEFYNILLIKININYETEINNKH